jgi:cell division protein FtsQ
LLGGIGPGFHSGRIPAFVVALAGIALLYGFLYSGDFLVGTVTVRGTELGNPADVVTTARAIGEPIFTIDATDSAERVAQLPYVERVEVTTRFPETVVITVTERIPAVVWSVAGRAFLVDARGHVIAEGGNEQLPLVTVDGDPPLVGGSVDPRDVAAVVAARETFGGDLTALEWSGANGLIARLTAERVVIFGNAGRMPAKLAVYAELQRQNRVNWAVLDLREPDRPYYK